MLDLTHKNDKNSKNNVGIYNIKNLGIESLKLKYLPIGLFFKIIIVALVPIACIYRETGRQIKKLII